MESDKFRSVFLKGNHCKRQGKSEDSVKPGIGSGEGETEKQDLRGVSIKG